MRVSLLGGWMVLMFCLAGARAETLLYVPPDCGATEPSGDDEELLRCHAPVFVAPETRKPYNRIGSPKIRRGLFGTTKVSVDPDAPTLYAEVHRDEVAGHAVLHLVYRVHFERIPFRFGGSFYEAHRNPGLLTIVTLDAASLAPVFVTSVHTCGCYRAVIPTHELAPWILPEEWPEELGVYGHTLPSRVPAPRFGSSRLVVSLNPDNHRVVSLEVAEDLPQGSRVDLPVLPMERLRSMPVDGDTDGRRASIFYGSGPLKGHVRGAWNPLEGLTLFGLVSLDPTVGMDKDFGDPDETGTPFYTMLRFWKHGPSRLDRFDPLLREIGFRLDGVGRGAE